MPSESPPGTVVSAETDDASAASGTASAASAGPDGSRPPTAELEPIEWSVRHDRLRSVAVGVGFVVALALAWAVAVVVATATRAALDGTLALGDAWVVVVFALVGGPVSVVYLLIGLDRSTPEGRRSLRSAFGEYALSPSTLRPGWVLAGALGLAAIRWIGPPSLTAGLWLLFPMLWLVPMVAGSKGGSIRLDPGRHVIERRSRSHDRTRTDDLDAVVRTRRIDLPWTTLFLLAFRGNEWYRSTPWLFVPSDAAADVERALDVVLSRSDGPDRASVPERVVLALVGGSSFVVGVTLALVAGESGGWALALFASPVSLLFLTLAARL